MSKPPNLTTREFTTSVADETRQNQDELEALTGVSEDRLDDTGERAEPARQQEREEEPAAERRIPMSPADEARANIAKRFNRDAEPVPFDGDMNREENLYGEVAEEVLEVDPNLPEPGGLKPDEDLPSPTPTPERMITMKVNGKQITLPESEVIARAQKVEAADEYLDQARKILNDSERIVRDPASQNPEGRSADADERTSDSLAQPQNPDAATEDLIEKIQFGDKKEAAQALAQYVQQEASKQANEGHLQRQRNNDIARSQKFLESFASQNPHINADRDAARMLEARIYDIYREEIAKQGVAPDKIPTNERDLAEWHRFYRMKGDAVSDVPVILEKARGYVEKRLFPERTNAKPQAERTKPAPNVNVNVDRTARREAIPNNPTRAVAPRRDAQTTTRPTSMSEAINKAKQARGQTV